MKIFICGLGLIGGSFAKAIKERTLHTVIGTDKDASVIDQALEVGAIDRRPRHMRPYPYCAVSESRD